MLCREEDTHTLAGSSGWISSLVDVLHEAAIVLRERITVTSSSLANETLISACNLFRSVAPACYDAIK